MKGRMKGPGALVAPALAQYRFMNVEITLPPGGSDAVAAGEGIRATKAQRLT